jgi:hypothetical protein
MQITVIDVGTPNTHAAKNGRSYQSLEVTYKGADGKVGNKKLMSFSNPSVFKAAGSWNKGDVVEVVSQKDDQGYWQWTGIGTEGGAPVAPAPASSTSGARVTGSNYETKEERAARQELIVRQSSLSNAISILTVGAKTVSKAEVLSLATELSDWVFGKDAKATVSYDPSNPADFEDDIPL